MKQRKQQAIAALKQALEIAVQTSAAQMRGFWFSADKLALAANDSVFVAAPKYSKSRRTGVKKGAIVRTIHSILSRKCQKPLSEEIGPGAAWLLGLWPKLTQLPWCQNAHSLTPPQSVRPRP